MQKLGIADLEEILDLIGSFNKIAGATVARPTSTWSWKNYFLNEAEPRYHAWGIYTDNKLQGMICWIDSQEIKAWYLSKLFIRTPDPTYKMIGELYEFAINTNEIKGVQQYFTVTPHDRAYDRLNIEARTRYRAYTEHIVHPGTLTGYSNIDKDLLAFTPWPVKLVVKHFILKNEYRK